MNPIGVTQSKRRTNVRLFFFLYPINTKKAITLLTFYSIFPNNYIDIYLKALDSDNKPMVGKLIENVKVLDGVEFPLTEVVSFTHTYAGEVIDGEHVVAKGKVEKVIQDGKDDYYRLVVGTTREAIDEYLKLKESPA